MEHNHPLYITKRHIEQLTRIEPMFLFCVNILHSQPKLQSYIYHILFSDDSSPHNILFFDLLVFVCGIIRTKGLEWCIFFFWNRSLPSILVKRSSERKQLAWRIIKNKGTHDVASIVPATQLKLLRIIDLDGWIEGAFTTALITVEFFHSICV